MVLPPRYFKKYDMARNKFIGKRSDYGRKEEAATVKVVHRSSMQGTMVEVLVLVLMDALEAVLSAIEDARQPKPDRDRLKGGRGSSADSAAFDYDVASTGMRARAFGGGLVVVGAGVPSNILIYKKDDIQSKIPLPIAPQHHIDPTTQCPKWPFSGTKGLSKRQLAATAAPSLTFREQDLVQRKSSCWKFSGTSRRLLARA